MKLEVLTRKTPSTNKQGWTRSTPHWGDWPSLGTLKSGEVTLIHRDGTPLSFGVLASLIQGNSCEESLYAIALNPLPSPSEALSEHREGSPTTTSAELEAESIRGALTESPDLMEYPESFSVLLASVHDYAELALSLSPEKLSALREQFRVRLAGLVRASDAFNESAPGVYALLMPDADFITLDRTARRLHDAFSEPFSISEKAKISVQLAIGTSAAASTVADGAEAVYQANVAVLKAKKQGAGHTVLFDHTLDDTLAKKEALLTQLASSSYDKDFMVYYQPQVNAISGKITGMEALLRWVPNQGAPRDATSFLKEGLTPTQLYYLSSRLRSDACLQMQEWLSQRFPVSRVSVNVATYELWHDTFYASIVDALAKAKLDGSHLELELEQTAFGRAPFDGLMRIKKLQALNLKLTLSCSCFKLESLVLARKYGVTRIKLSKDIIQVGLHDEQRKEALGYVIQAARALQFLVTAEGIETAEQAHGISETTVDTLQGFYFGAPVPPEFLQAALQSTKEKVRLNAV